MHQATTDATAWPLLAASPSHFIAARGSHIIVLTHAQPGAGTLGAPGGLLTGHPSLACEADAGVLRLCEQAASTWRRAERTGSTLSALAAASVRAMAGSLISVIKSQEGRDRWCEISAAPAHAARTFLRIYPETTVVCLHRNCADVVHAGLPGQPDDAVTAAVTDWTTRTESLLALERDQPGQCLRVRYEDLVTRPAAAAGLLSCLGLDRRPGLDWCPYPPPASPAFATAAHTAALAAGRIDDGLLEQVNRLHAELGYPALGPGQARGE
jgi:hypothetical protein